MIKRRKSKFQFYEVLGISVGLHVAVLMIVGGMTLYRYLTPEEAEFIALDDRPLDPEKQKYQVKMKKRSRESASPKTELIQLDSESDFSVPKVEITVRTPTKGNARGRGKGNGWGDGWGTGTGMGNFSGFMGIKPQGSRIVFVLDVSSSMRGKRFSKVYAAARSSLSSMGSNMMFNVVVFHGEAKSFKGGKMLEASPSNIKQAINWIKDQDPELTKTSGTNPAAGIESAFRMKPEQMILLSDGRPTAGDFRKKDEILAAIADWQEKAKPRVVINTIAFQADEAAEELMAAIAEANGGQYKKR